MISWWPWTKCAYRLFFPRGRQLTGFGFSERGVCARCPTSCPPIAPPDSERGRTGVYGSMDSKQSIEAMYLIA